MRDIRDLIDEWIFEIEELIELVRATSRDWWWLDSGNRPFVRVNVMKINYKRKFPLFWKKIAIPEFILSDLLSPHVALTVIRDNLKKSKELRGIHLARALLRVREDINDITKAVSVAKEADKIINTLDSLLEQTKNLADRSKFENRIKDLMERLTDIVTQDYRNWEERKKEILNAMEVLKKEIEKAPAVKKVVEKPKVVEEVKEEEVETA